MKNIAEFFGLLVSDFTHIQGRIRIILSTGIYYAVRGIT